MSMLWILYKFVLSLSLKWHSRLAMWKKELWFRNSLDTEAQLSIANAPDIFRALQNCGSMCKLIKNNQSPSPSPTPHTHTPPFYLAPNVLGIHGAQCTLSSQTWTTLCLNERQVQRPCFIFKQHRNSMRRLLLGPLKTQQVPARERCGIYFIASGCSLDLWVLLLIWCFPVIIIIILVL